MSGAKAWAKLGLTPVSISLRDTPHLWVLSVSSGFSLSVKHLDQALLSHLIVMHTLKHRCHCDLGFVKKENENPSKIYINLSELNPWWPETERSDVLCPQSEHA